MKINFLLNIFVASCALATAQQYANNMYRSASDACSSFTRIASRKLEAFKKWAKEKGKCFKKLYEKKEENQIPEINRRNAELDEQMRIIFESFKESLKERTNSKNKTQKAAPENDVNIPFEEDTLSEDEKSDEREEL